MRQLPGSGHDEGIHHGVTEHTENEGLAAEDAEATGESGKPEPIALRSQPDLTQLPANGKQLTAYFYSLDCQRSAWHNEPVTSVHIFSYVSRPEVGQ